MKDDNVLLAGTKSGDLMKIVLKDQIVPKISALNITTPILKMTASSTLVYGRNSEHNTFTITP